MSEIVKDGVASGLYWTVWELVTEIPEGMPQGMLNSNWFCGYVRIPEGHPLYEVDYTDPAPGVTCADTKEAPRLEILFDAHGSLTFSGKLRDRDGWWLGFDCNHLDDRPEIQDAAYTARECESLARQIVERYPLTTGDKA